MHKNNKPNLIMMYVILSTFTKRDIALLSDEFNVIPYHFNTSSKFNLPFAFIKQFFYLLFRINKTNIIVTQSAGYLSFLPVIFQKISKMKVVIIAIGTDCAKLPKIKYGAHTRKLLSWFTNYSFKQASLILPVHKSLEKTTYTYDDVLFPNQGIRNFAKNIKTPIIEVVNGYDTEKWNIINEKRIAKSFLTVSFAIDRVGYYRKGIDMIVKLAEHFPDYHFTIVGKVILQESKPLNVTLIENVPQKELLKIYNSNEYYLQLSMFEGFPNALCEAMLCGCIPIGSDVAGIPDIIGNKGYILKKKKIRDLVEIVENIENSHSFSPAEARNQIKDNFPITKRKEELTDTILKLLT